MGAILILTTMLVLPQQPGSVFGIITDTTGEGLPGARVAITAEDGRVREATTSSLGRYRIDGLSPGKYRIEAGMNGFETKVSAVSVVPAEVVVWSGALLLGPVIGEGSIERRVTRHTGWDAVDCGRHGAPVSQPHLERSLACGIESAQHRRPFAVIVQIASNGSRVGHGLIAGNDGVIHRFEYDRGGLGFRLQPCPSPRVAPREKAPGFGFTCQA